MDKRPSDHNPLFCSFNLLYEKLSHSTKRKEIYDMKSKEGQEAFKIATEDTTKFTDIFENEESFESQTLKFQRCLKQSVQQCFRKIRVKNKEKETEVGKLLKIKINLNIFSLQKSM
jgi:hypothetical protein